MRFAPGYGVTEQEPTIGLSADSLRAIRQSHAAPGNLIDFYLQYGGRILRGDLGYCDSLGEPVRQLISERFPETIKSVGFGVVLGWRLSV